MHQAIVASAREWVGTRFHHQGRIKKATHHSGGVDCLGLLVGIASELDLRSRDNTPLQLFDEQNYSHYPDGSYLKMRLSALLTPVEIEAIKSGDILLLDVQGTPQHLAIVSDLPDGQGIIHAYAPARAVVEHRLDTWWRRNITAAFRIH